MVLYKEVDEHNLFIISAILFLFLFGGTSNERYSKVV